MRFKKACVISTGEKSLFLKPFFNSLIVKFIKSPTEDSHFKEYIGHSPASKWEMNVG